MFGINYNTGAWYADSHNDMLEQHTFDESLCNAISNFLKNKNCKSVYDLGCGNGQYTKNLIRDGFDCSGFDGNTYTEQFTNGLCKVLLLNEPVNLTPVDCTICLELTEHIPSKYEDVVVDNIINSTKNLIILSWAIVGQGGYGHLNERNNDYVKDRFKSRGFINLLEEENVLRNSSTLPWFKNTIMIFSKEN